MDLHLDFLHLGHDHNRRRRGMDPPATFRLRHTLDTVRAPLELEVAESAPPFDGDDDLPEPAQTARARGEHLGLPTHSLRVAGIHPEEVTSKERRLFAARAGTDLDDRVLLVVRILRQEHQDELPLHRLAAGHELPELLLGEIPKLPFRLLDQPLGFCELPLELLELAELCDNVRQLGVRAGRLLEPLLVPSQVGVAQLLGEAIISHFDVTKLI
jgi:hypothetical protein